MQRVFGFNVRLPASLLSDDHIEPAYLAEDPHTDFKRAEDLRQVRVLVRDDDCAQGHEHR